MQGVAPTTETGVNRNTSVRSVMTLPAYMLTPTHDEQVIGREGERGGVDIVLEFPEAEANDEARREEEMESMYQVRVARRRENEEREQRRILRREARARGDTEALRELHDQAHAPSVAGQTVAQLRADVERLRADRTRAVSSVSYADLGVARHDGTRLRANTGDSEQDGLLGDSASISASSYHHRRDRSASSVLSMDSDMAPLGGTRSRATSRGNQSLHQINTNTGDDSGNDGRAGSSPEIINHEDHEEFPPNSPPGYENVSLDASEDHRINPPPDYSSPVLTRAPTFPPLESGSEGTTTSPEGGSNNTPSSSSGQEHHTSDRQVSPVAAVSVPHLPSLTITSIPSIQVDSATPITGPRRVDSDTEAAPRS